MPFIKRNGSWCLSCLAMLPVLIALLAGVFAQQADNTVVIARAATLTVPFDQLARELPKWRFQQESGGSRFLVRKLQDLHPRQDVLAVADASLFEQLATSMRDAPVSWWLLFARNELVIAFTPHSKFAEEINAANWPDILLRPGIRFGYADPNLDPEGYNTLVAWKLAERFYRRPGLNMKLMAAVPNRFMRPQSVALLALLETGELDYAWQYMSVARQHGLRFIRLPPEINLGDPNRKAEYESVSVQLAGSQPGITTEHRGEPIEYAITIPSTAVNRVGAEDFISALISARGRSVLESNNQLPIVPVLARGKRELIPASLNSYLH